MKIWDLITGRTRVHQVASVRQQVAGVVAEFLRKK